MTVLASIILMSIVGTTTISSAPPNLIENQSQVQEEDFLGEKKNEILRVVEDEIKNSATVLTNDGMIDNAVDRVQDEVFNGSLEEEQVIEIKELSNNQMMALNQADLIIGDVSNGFITLKTNVKADREMLLTIVDYYVGRFYPELEDKNTTYRFKHLPDPSLPITAYQARVIEMRDFMDARPVLFSEMNIIRRHRISINTPDPGSGIEYYHLGYDFSYLEAVLDKMDRDLGLAIAGATAMTISGLFMLICPFTIQLGWATIAVSLMIHAFYAAILIVNDMLNNIGDDEEKGLNEYEKAVIYKHFSYFEHVELKNSLTSSKAKAELYFKEIYGGSLGNNHGDAFRHTYWMSLLTYEIGENFAKEFGDAHEYGPYIAGEVNSLSAKLALDMDLLNNATGRFIGRRWGKAKNNFIAAVQRYDGVVLSDYDALSYQVLHYVAYGHHTLKVHTFANDVKLNQAKIEVSPYYSLVYTNFGEEENWLKTVGNVNTPYSKRPYFSYPLPSPELPSHV